MLVHAAQALSLIRMAFGLYFVVSALRKTTGGWLSSSDQMVAFIGRNQEGSAALYSSFLESIVLPNADRVSQLVVVGEWVAGISLLAGFLTRAGALVGMWLVLNFMLTKGPLNFEGSQDRLFFASCAVFAVSAAGLVWGADGLLRTYLESNPVTRWLAGLQSRPRVLRPRVFVPVHRRLHPTRRRGVA